MSAGAPNIAALLGGGQGGPPGGQHTIQVQPPGGGGPDPAAMLRGLAASGPSGGSKSVTVDTVIDDLHSLAGNTDDPADKQTILKCLTAIQGIKAQESKEKDAALGTTPAHKFMAKQSAAGSGY
jgi:hypothetical protein